MELNTKGYLSYLILTCMQERDFYGLDIITEISTRSNGQVNLKKPSVYSNLTRMENQGYISSYLKNSDLGPNRKYYSITEKGRRFYRELDTYFSQNKIEAFSFDARTEASPTLHEEEHSVEGKQEPLPQDLEPVIEEQGEDGFFDFSSLTEEKENYNQENLIKEQENVEEEIEPIISDEKEIEQDKERQSQSVHLNYSIKQALQEQKEEKQEQQEAQKRDDGVFLSREEAEQYNKRLYDISKDINKIKRKRSFAEDQISMGSTAPLLSTAQEKSRNNIEEFKNSLIENKNRYENARLNDEEFARHMGHLTNQETELAEESKNDAVYITKRIDESKIDRARKIAPPTLQIMTDFSRKEKLPAPKRDTTIDPSHKEILSRLYSRTKDSVVEEEREDGIYDYNDLQEYYQHQQIAFSVYKKPQKRIKHNTNKIYVSVSGITFALASIVSALIYIILLNTKALNPNTNFLFILIPALFLTDVVIKIYKVKQSYGWLPNKILPHWAIWISYFLLNGVIIGVNFACGMTGETYGLFATTLILPLSLSIVLLPVRYYIKRLALIKYWK